MNVADYYVTYKDAHKFVSYFNLNPLQALCLEQLLLTQAQGKGRAGLKCTPLNIVAFATQCATLELAGFVVLRKDDAQV